MASILRRERPRLEVIPGGDAPAATPGRPGAPARADEEIVSGARRGEAWAAAALHDRVRPAVDRTLRRLVGRRDSDYADLAQNALIEVASTLSAFRGECSLDSWATMITSRLVFKQFRRRSLERRLFSNLEDDHFEVAGVAPARATHAKQALGRIVDHLRAMDEGRAWAYWLHDVAGHDLREVAEIMSVSVAAAQSRLVRGRKELHERIRNDPELASVLEEVGS